MKNILVNKGVRYDKVALMNDNKLIDFYVEDHSQENHVDGIYFGIVKDSVKKYDSVFIDIGLDKNAYMSKDNTDKLPLEGEKVLCQVIKDETDTKGVSVSKNISLVGRYIVLIINRTNKNMPKSKIMFSNDLDKNIIDDLRKNLEGKIELNDNEGIVVRSEAKNVSIDQIIKDYVNLTNEYKSILKEFEYFTSDKKIKDVRAIYKKNISDIVINEFYDKDINEIICDTDETKEEIVKRMNQYDLDSSIVKTYEKGNSNMTLFETFKVDDEVKKALGKYAWLKSGGQIVIDYTEAMTVIDVNSKKCEGKKEIEQSSLKVNIEACHEIARQIRLRNISGIIMIDFINLKEEENKKILIDTLKECVKDDKMQVNVLGLTKLGLCEMTRQKKRKMLKDILK